MKRHTCVALIVLACLWSGPLLAAAGSAQDAADFTALEARWLHAIAAHDTVTLGRILAPDFIDTMWNGQRRNRVASLAHARQAGSMGEQRLSDITVRRYGNVAVVTGLNSVLLKGGRRYDIRFTDVFVWHGKRWQAVSAQETPIAGPKR